MRNNGFKIDDVLMAIKYLKDRGHKHVTPIFTHGENDNFKERIMRFHFDGGHIDIYKDFDYRQSCLYRAPRIVEEKDLESDK